MNRERNGDETRMNRERNGDGTRMIREWNVNKKRKNKILKKELNNN